MSKRHFGVWRDDFLPVPLPRRPPYLHNARETTSNCLLLPSPGRYTETGSVGRFPLSAPLPFLPGCSALTTATGQNQEVAVKARYLQSIRCIHSFRTGSLGGRSASSGGNMWIDAMACTAPTRPNGTSAPMLRTFGITLSWCS